MTDIKGKIAVLTGVGRGVGFATVRLFLDEGMKVLATSRNTAALDAIDHDNLPVVLADLVDLSSL